jgi:hypothetical protein
MVEHFMIYYVEWSFSYTARNVFDTNFLIRLEFETVAKPYILGCCIPIGSEKSLFRRSFIKI